MLSEKYFSVSLSETSWWKFPLKFMMHVSLYRQYNDKFYVSIVPFTTSTSNTGWRQMFRFRDPDWSCWCKSFNVCTFDETWYKFSCPKSFALMVLFKSSAIDHIEIRQEFHHFCRAHSKWLFASGWWNSHRWNFSFILRYILYPEILLSPENVPVLICNAAERP